MSDVDLERILRSSEQALRATLGGARAWIGHAPSKGTISEEKWRDVIAKFLPNRYTVSTNVFVVGANNTVSEQIDLAVHDAHFCPLFFEEGGIRFIPSESVFAVFDCKQEISKATIEATQQKVESVRSIHRTNREIIERGKKRPPRDEFDIVGGILALDSGWKAGLFGKPLQKALAAASTTARLDLGCALTSGAFEARYPEGERLQIDLATEATLMFLLMRLFSLLQTIGSPMAIDLREYSKPLEVVDEIPSQE